MNCLENTSGYLVNFPTKNPLDFGGRYELVLFVHLIDDIGLVFGFLLADFVFKGGAILLFLEFDPIFLQFLEPVEVIYHHFNRNYIIFHFNNSNLHESSFSF